MNDCKQCKKRDGLWCTHKDEKVRRYAEHVNRRKDESKCGREGRWFIPLNQ